MIERLDRLLALVAGAHLLVAIACALWLARPANPIVGLHPAVKPLKFAISIAIFLATMAWVLPRLSVGDATRAVMRWSVAGSMVIEMVVIAAQAARGRMSHFNTQTWFDSVQWRVMMVAVVVLSAAMLGIAIVASARPFAASPLVAITTRIALWLFMLSTVSGFAMGGRGRHSVGGGDGGGGLPFLDWSTRFGDLRISHFFALHAIQLLPVAGAVLASALRHDAIGPAVAWSVALAFVAAYAGIVVWTLARAFAGQPPW